MASTRAAASARPRPEVDVGGVIWTVVKYATAIMIVLVTALPLVWMLMTSFKVEADIFRTPPVILFPPTTQAWQRTIFDNDQFLRYFANSALVSVSVTFLTVSASSLAAYALARYDFAGSRLLALGILSARLVPGATMIIPYFVLFRWLRLIDTIPGLTLAYVGFSLPFACWLMYGFFLEIPGDVEDSARVDGCSDLQTFWHVSLPLTLPGLGTTAILVFIGAWNEFLFSLVLAGREAKTLPVYLASSVTEHYVRWGDLFAVAAVMIVPMVLLTILVQKSLVRGLTAGAVKG